MGNSNDSSTGQFIDPMFAVVIAAAVNETFVSWVKDITTLPQSQIEWWIVIIGFFNILLSWFGYHKSVSKKPIKGELRFIITVILLPLYLFTIMFYQKPIEYVVWVYALIFLFWIVWERLKVLEYKSENTTSAEHKANILFNFHNSVMLFAVFLSIYSSTLNYGHFASYQIALVGIAIISLRITKAEESTLLGGIRESLKKFSTGS